MCGHLLGDFQLAAVLEIGRDAGSAEGVTADLCFYPGLGSSPANHSPHIGLQHGTVGQLAAAPPAGAEERPFPILGDAGRRDILLQVEVEIVVGWHLVLLAAFLVEPHPSAPSLNKEVLHLHGNRRTHAGEGVDHQSDQRPIAQAGQGSGVDRVEQRPRLVHIQNWRLAAPLRVLRSAYRVGRVRGYDLADNHPIEEHSQRGQT
jgi:hypothetical protein